MKASSVSKLARVCRATIQIYLFIELQGLIDFGKEATKLQDKKNKLEDQRKGLEKAAEKADYITKVPENVRQQNTEKVIVFISVIKKISDIMEIENTVGRTCHDLKCFSIKRIGSIGQVVDIQCPVAYRVGCMSNCSGRF